MLKRIGEVPLFVSIAETKRRIHFEGAADEENDDIELMLRAAARRVEQRTGRILALGQFEYRFDCWSDCMVLPIAPVRVVTGVAYLDVDHVEQEVPAADWYETIGDRDARVTMVDGFSQPELSARGGQVIVRFDAGYDTPDASGSGDDPALERDPMDVQAVLMLVAHWWLNRSAVGATSMETTPQGFEDLVAEQRIYR